MKNNKFFTTLLAASALFVAGCAAFFSVRGIGILFAGAQLQTMVMASSLEIGKLVSTSFLYRYYTSIPKLLRYYLFTAVILLMFITSLGIYGFLSAAYEKSSDNYSVYTQQIQSLQSQKDGIIDRQVQIKQRIQGLLDARKSQEDRLNETVKQFGTGTVSVSSIKHLQDATQTQISNSSTQVDTCNSQLDALNIEQLGIDKKILDIKNDGKNTKDIQTFQFVADAFGVTLNTVVKWFTLCIIFVFDPLAVGLILAFNVASYGHIIRDTKETKNKIQLPPETQDPFISPTKLITETETNIPIEIESSDVHIPSEDHSIVEVEPTIEINPNSPPSSVNTNFKPYSFLNRGN